MRMNWLRATAVGVLATFATTAAAKDTFTIGLLTDMTGILSSAAGPGSVIAAEMAIEDYGKPLLGKEIRLISADHQNKGDLGSSIARKWLYDEDVKLFMDITSSVVALALRELVQDNNIAMIYGSSSSAELTNSMCSPNTVAWNHDSYQMAKVAEPLVAQGMKSWFLIVQDWAFGHSMQEEITKFIENGGGEVLGAVRHPPGATDYASFLLQAQASGADAIGLLSTVTDLDNMTKQTKEFGVGVDGSQSIVAPATLWSNVAGLGPESAQGVLFSVVWYWNANPEAAAWSKRFYERAGFMPSEAHAAAYSSLMHYFKAVEELGETEGDKVIAKMKEFPVNDFYTDNATIRADGRLMRKVYIAQVKAPADVTEEFDYYDILEIVPGENAFRPADESVCPLFNPKG